LFSITPEPLRFMITIGSFAALSILWHQRAMRNAHPGARL
jgi:hypothetical protein